MNRSVKVGLYLICAGIILMAVGFIFGGFKSITLDSNGFNVVDNGSNFTHEEKSLDNFQNIDIECDYSDIEIVKGSEFSIESQYRNNYDNISFNVEENTLKIKEKSKKNFSVHINIFGNDIYGKSNKIKISIPENASLSQIKCKSDTGNITLKSLKGSTVTCNMEYGDFEIHDSSFEKLIVENKCGNVKGTALETNGLNLKLNYGDVNINGKFKGENIIDSEKGDIYIASSLKENDYTYDTNLKLGDCKINGKKFSNEYKKVDASLQNSFIINSKYGDLKIDLGV